MYITLTSYLGMIASVCAVYTSTLYLFFIFNYLMLVDRDKEDPLIKVIRRGAQITILLYILAGLAYLAG